MYPFLVKMPRSFLCCDLNCPQLLYGSQTLRYPIVDEIILQNNKIRIMIITNIANRSQNDEWPYMIRFVRMQTKTWDYHCACVHIHEIYANVGEQKEYNYREWLNNYKFDAGLIIILLITVQYATIVEIK